MSNKEKLSLITDKLNENLEANKQIEFSIHAEVKKMNLRDICCLAEDICQSNNLPFILNLEKTILRHDLGNYANSGEMTISLKASLDDLKGAFDSLDVVGDHEKYQAVKKTTHKKTFNRVCPLTLSVSLSVAIKQDLAIC